MSRSENESGRLRELIVLFGTLGVIGFGGPAAHIALMRREVVERRAWLTDAEMVDLVGLTSIIPGPNSTELAMLVGMRRAGRLGLLVAGLSFILPAATIVLAIAWAYVAYGATPAAEALLHGVAPVILAIVLLAIVAFARTAVRTLPAAAIAVGAGILWLVGVNELLLFAGGAVAMALIRGGHTAANATAAIPWLATAGATAAVDLVTLGGVFLKAGAFLFGSGYVLLAFLRGDLVERLGWLTDAQLLDAVAIGQVTPGPLFTTATFIGYVVAGLPGALVATVAIFAPAFIITALIGPRADRIRERPITAALLDGVNAAAIGLMAAVLVELGRASLVDVPSVVIGVVAGLLLWRTPVPSAVLVLGGGAIGVLMEAMPGGI